MEKVPSMASVALLKRSVWRRILQGNKVINNAKEFYECAKDACPNINVLFLSSDDMSCDRTILSEKWDATQPKSIPNLHKIHYVRASNPQVVAISSISPFMDNIRASFIEVTMFDEPDSEVLEKNLHTEEPKTATKMLEFGIGNYIVVQYEGQKYPGIITEMNNHMGQRQKEVKVNVMHKCVGGYLWPKTKDEIWYTQEQVLDHLDPPFPINNRRLYSFKGFT